MKKTYICILLSFALALLVPATTAAQIPETTGASLQASVTGSGTILTYTYVATNPPKNAGEIWTIDIDISQPTDGAILSGQGLTNGPRFLSASSNAVAQQKVSTPTVSVGIDSPPNWFASLSVLGTASWAAGDTPFLIMPGQSIGGYQLTSPGLPTIRGFTIKPHLNPDTLPISPPTGPNDVQRYLNDLEVIEKQVRTQGVTVGPTAPPASFAPDQFLITIENYKEAAVKQGWITNPGVANSLDVKLNTALSALQKQDTTTAKNVLNALLNEVDAQSGKHLTSEAVALLQFNVQFLISKLP